jgi:hypothetical protein
MSNQSRQPVTNGVMAVDVTAIPAAIQRYPNSLGEPQWLANRP